jgi:molybdate transport system substrate-binding protein
MYCAAGLRQPVERIVAEYQRAYGTPVQLQFGGSNTLLSQMSVAQAGELFLAADDSYIALARQKGLLKETIPVATQRPVIAVRKGNPHQIRGIDDLLRDDIRVALANPDQAAIGNTARQLLSTSGHWPRLEAHVTRTGVFKPTVPEIANDVKLGSVDAGIVWDTTLALYDDLEAVRTPELDAGTAEVILGVLARSEQPTEALKFARYLTARDKGLLWFQEYGFRTVEGDKWAEVPQLTFFCGSVNRRAVESVINAFEQREGVRVNTVYNGCGILTAQMRTIQSQQQGGGFPDTYLACDRYYLDTVKEWFQDDVEISDTEVVIAVPKGNPAKIQNLRDLTKPGVRVTVGQPQQCTIGVLTRQLLEAEGVLDEVMKNVVAQTASSAMLVPTVATGSVDATLAYATDTLAEADKVDTIRIDSPAAKAIQPFAISRSSDYKFLSRRLYQALAESRATFEMAGFHFRVPEPTP